jgi:hypothetical protein
MPQPLCNSGNAACRVSNTLSCCYVIQPTCPPLMPPLLYWQKIAGQPDHQPPTPPPPPPQRRGWHLAFPASSAAEDNQVQQWQRHLRCRTKEYPISSLQQQSWDLPLRRAFPQCHFATTPQCLAPTHPRLLSYPVPFHGAIEGTAASTDSVTWVHLTPSAMGMPPPRVLDFLSKTQQSVSSVSHSLSQKKRSPPFEHIPKPMIVQAKGPSMLLLMIICMLILQVNMMLMRITSTSPL